MDSSLDKTVGGLARFVGRTLVRIVQLVAAIFLIALAFLLAVIYGALWAVRYALPWLMRIACVVAWILGLCAGFSGVAQLYGEIADPLPTIAVSIAAAIPTVVTPALALLFERKQTWGALMFAALVGLTEWLLATNAHSFPKYRVIASALPPVLASMLMIYLAARFKLRTRGPLQRRSNV